MTRDKKSEETSARVLRLRALIVAAFTSVEGHKGYYITTGQWGLRFDLGKPIATSSQLVGVDKMARACCALSSVALEMELQDNRTSIGSDSIELFLSFNLALTKAEIGAFIGGFDSIDGNVVDDADQPWKELGKEMQKEARLRNILADTWERDDD